MEIRPRSFLWIALAIVGLMVVGWFSRPPTLAQKIKNAGVHLEMDKHFRGHSPPYAFQISKTELPRLLAVLTEDGYVDNSHPVGGSTMMYHDLIQERVRPFWSGSRHIRVFDQAQCQVFFEQNLK